MADGAGAGGFDPFGDPFGAVDVQLGSSTEEAREFLRRPLETDEYRQAQLETLVEMVRLLGDVAENTGGTTRLSSPIERVGGADSETGVAPGTEPDSAVHVPARYFSTGVSGEPVDSTEWDSVDFGLTATEVNVRHTDDVDVSLVDPEEYPDKVVPLFEASSVTIGGYEGLGATRLYYRQGTGASGPPTIYVLAQ